MTKKKPTLPPRKWYSLQQAADKLTREFGELVTIDDLLHYYQIDLLELSIHIGTSESTIKIGNNIFSTYEKLDGKDTYPRECLEFNLISEYEKDISIEHIFSMKKGTTNVYQNELIKTTITVYDQKLDELISINGFMNIWGNSAETHEDIEKIKEKGFNLGRINYLVSPNNGDNYRAVAIANLSESTQEDVFITLDNIYILASDLNNFLEGKETKQPNEIIENQKNKSPRQEANQLEFIRALLKAHYGTDDPNECRKLLYNGKLSKDFTRAKIAPDIISPETLRNWLKSEK